MRRMLRLGVDTGGTFTDFVLLDADGTLRVHKVLSTPDAPERAILQGVAEMGLAGQPLHLVHGSTVATNAVLEGKGVKTLYVGNRGFADLLNIGRQQRAALYDLQPAATAPVVAPDLCIETGGRLRYEGLRAWDALGRELPAWMEADDDVLLGAERAQGVGAVAHRDGCRGPVQRGSLGHGVSLDFSRHLAARARSTSRKIIGVRMSCMARSSLSPGMTIELARVIQLPWIIATR